MKTIFNNKVIKKEIDDFCNICFNKLEISQELLECKQCKKIAHTKCINKWFKFKEECPSCRYSKTFRYNDYDLDSTEYNIYVGNMNIYFKILNYLIISFSLIFFILILIIYKLFFNK